MSSLDRNIFRIGRKTERYPSFNLDGDPVNLCSIGRIEGRNFMLAKRTESCKELFSVRVCGRELANKEDDGKPHMEWAEDIVRKVKRIHEIMTGIGCEGSIGEYSLVLGGKKFEFTILSNSGLLATMEPKYFLHYWTTNSCRLDDFLPSVRNFILKHVDIGSVVSCSRKVFDIILEGSDFA